MDDLLKVSASPHVRHHLTSRRIMLYVIAALTPACLFGIYNFGFKAFLLIYLCVSTCVGTEYVYEKYMKKTITVSDMSAAVTGLLLAMNLPVDFPWWGAILGSVFAILVVKQLFGGLGHNFMNPALGGRCFLLISFTGYMNTFTYDGITQATPLALMRSGESVDVLSMFLGTTGGTIGETSALALLLGAALLLWLGIINIRIPGSYLLSFSLFILLFGGRGLDFSYLLAQLFGGGLMLGVFFMATDYVTSPITYKGQVIYGCLLGILTGIFRIFGGSPEGVSYAIIFGNLFVPLIEKVTIPKPFGKGGEGR